MKSVIRFGLGLFVVGAVSCGTSNSVQERTHFSRTDSLTDIYLVLQDSLLESWNRVIRVELERTEALGLMIEQLQHSTIIDEQQSRAFNERLAQIERIRFTQKSMNDPHVIEEYDRALEDLLEKITSFSNSNAQELQDFNQFNAQQRRYYDSVARQFNSFIELNWSDLQELGNSVQLEQKALFVSK